MSNDETSSESQATGGGWLRQFLAIDRKVVLGVAGTLTFTGLASVPGNVAGDWLRARVLGASQAITEAGTHILNAPSGQVSAPSPVAGGTATAAPRAPVPVGSFGGVSGVTTAPQPGPSTTAVPVPAQRRGSSPSATPRTMPVAPLPITTATPVPASTPSSSPTPAGFRVVDVLLRADPFDYNGDCPTTITFSGRISVAGGSGTVSYRFIRSDGAMGPVQSLSFDGPGSKDVTTTWQRGAGSGWEAIQIYDPTAMQSAQATFTIRCTPQ
jgi:hypothetical protein